LAATLSCSAKGGKKKRETC
jgi:hypothetical protein